MFRELLGEKLYSETVLLMSEPEVTEIRLRAGRNMSVRNASMRKISSYVVGREDVSAVMRRATRSSLYACQEELKAGYLSYSGGIRIGIGGEGVTESDKVLTYKNISSLNIRVPHEVKGCADSLKGILSSSGNIIVLSPPYGGKTTLIRDISRILSYVMDTLIIDEREEICSDSYDFGPLLDIISNTPKHLAVEGAIRSMNPEVIVMDELYPVRDGAVVGEIMRSGIRLVASAHATNPEDFFCKAPLLRDCFAYAVVLGYKPRAGSIKSVLRL